jgi:hypothetical protein
VRRHSVRLCSHRDFTGDSRNELARKFDDETGTEQPVAATLGPDAPAVQAHVFAHERQPETGTFGRAAFAGLCAAGETLEDLVLFTLDDSLAVVLDDHPRVCDGGVVGGDDAHGRGARTVLASVVEQVRHDPGETTTIADDDPVGAALVDVDFGVRQRAGKHRLAHEFGEPQTFAGEAHRTGVVTGDFQQVFDEAAKSCDVGDEKIECGAPTSLRRRQPAS